MDTYSSYAFAFLHPSKQTEAAVAVLHNGALPFFHERGLPVKAVLSSSGPEFWGHEALPYRLYLSLVGVAQRTPQAQLPGANGFIARFYRTVLSEFFQQALRQTFYTSLDGLQEDLDRWLEHYNTVRVLEGFPNLGAPPSQRMMEYLEGAQRGDGSHAASHGGLLSRLPRQDAQAA
ncbi:MAG: transposase [Chloroflexi bacterium]|nr:transposase [Chloroflexota bacterium]